MKNKMKKKIILVILFLPFIFAGCLKSQTQLSNSQRLSLEPKQVVENYFKYRNEKNSKGILSTLTEKYATYNTIWEFENLKSSTLNTIVEESNTELAVIYKVEYELKNKKDGVSSQDSGKYIWTFTVIRKDKNSPWLIDNYGEG